MLRSGGGGQIFKSGRNSFGLRTQRAARKGGMRKREDLKTERCMMQNDVPEREYLENSMAITNPNPTDLQNYESSFGSCIQIFTGTGCHGQLNISCHC